MRTVDAEAQEVGEITHPTCFGDCMTYAVAKAEGRALLFTGGDFTRTDVNVAESGG